MLEKLKREILYGGMTQKEFQIILNDGIKTNYHSLRVYSVLCLFF